MKLTVEGTDEVSNEEPMEDELATFPAADSPREIAAGALASRAARLYQRSRLAPQVRPPPQALSITRSLSWMRLASSASSSAIGTEAAEVLP